MTCLSDFCLTEHAILNKWAVIIDPKDPLSGPTGFVKVDIHVVGKGQISKVLFTFFCGDVAVGVVESDGRGSRFEELPLHADQGIAETSVH
ncbi:unnamed protein product [Protopolystoma xenopodis]|uniref:Uncharacterized protein n=1 Tax=Protopolystoma xenopodis TaxID=117903 RepID=A0A448XT21_9PLAT|nr:unnamed protein product [Protopolystoma xenopodis]